MRISRILFEEKHARVPISRAIEREGLTLADVPQINVYVHLLGPDRPEERVVFIVSSLELVEQENGEFEAICRVVRVGR